LEKVKIKIQQAFYGEVNKAHSKIKITTNDSELASFLTSFTDRPASLPPGIELQPYLSGCAYSKYYILTKTFADKSATRAGMVFTHVLIFNLSDILLIHNLESILSLFVHSTESKSVNLNELEIEITDTNTLSENRVQPRYIQQTISAFINGVTPILFSGDIATFSKAVQQIWNSPNIEFRKKIKFRTSFSLADIENVRDLTIVSIQKEFLPKWQSRNIIQSDNSNTVEIISHSEALFLGYKNDNPFYHFLSELNADFSEVQKYGQYEKIFSNYNSIDNIEDADILRHDIRVLSKLCPLQSDGKKIKNRFIERLSTLIANRKNTNVKALRNIDWSAFENGEIKAQGIVSQFLVSELEKENPINAIVSELLRLSIEENPKNWWHNAISASLTSAFNKQGKTVLNNIWSLIDSTEISLKNVLSIISSTPDCDSILRKHIPVNLKMETCMAVIPIAQKKNWYLFHADILLKYLSIQESIEKQIQLESKLPLSASIGLKYLCDKLQDEKLIELAVKSNDHKLIELSVTAISKDISLLNEIDLSVAGWLELWTALVLKTKKVFNGLVGKEQTVVTSVLDLLVTGKPINSVVLSLIADTTFSDISDYKNRKKVWSFLSGSDKEKFLTITTHNVLKQLLNGKIESKSIESEISEQVTSDAFLAKFRSENWNNIEPILKVYNSFDNLKDIVLSDYIQKYRGAISEEQSKLLGRIAMENKFSKTARTIYEKAKYHNSYYPAYQECKEIVSLNWWESLLGLGDLSGKSSKSTKITIPVMSSEQKSRADLPTVVILTAIKEEYAAVKSHLKEVVEADRNDTNYEVGIFEFNGKEIAKVFIRECGAKNTTASQETERAIQYFKPDMMFFVGIAGSRKPNDFKVGDVIFPVKVFSYEGGKSEKEAFVARPDIGDLTFALKEIAKKERRKDDWKILIKGNWKQDFSADLGVIASGEKVIEHYDSEIGEILKKHYNDTSAVEMEGFGFAKAANSQGRETNKLMIGIVRGISDIIEQPTKGKKKESNSDRRPANAKEMASDTAAAFAFWLIFKTYE
jgi:nucleoside phosphorylase